MHITYFNAHETRHHDTIFNHRIDMYRRSLVCAFAVYVHACACVSVCADTFMYIYTQVTRVCQDIPHHMSGTFNKHSSLAIIDEHLVRQTNLGWPQDTSTIPLLKQH